ncbi:zinc finger MYND domain-containing protein 12 isoform X4 [Brienomyrus brachyistius]|uniref:zinc finger MYND domain-containing protein 12 isoform X4 n=1 Tax=Brienomyrus brachyistius TaxID=42636 RepID=UPI0020B2889D|nr:zinc finger MYND domain-containing protein 12 isoform X4 [Brienomyrus brachyistius]XP_048872377.1 zinc finger MYND domain-containing protein 12 isoform X4 [Brienomyrus brachyistius]XP_048872378.1 zinc finger MYND domain-containing protein 12 isoform X4 [Brienomyrus brachyistius]
MAFHVAPYTTRPNECFQNEAERTTETRTLFTLSCNLCLIIRWFVYNCQSGNGKILRILMFGHTHGAVLQETEGLGRFSQAEEYLAQAEWIIMKTPECSLGVRHQLHRNLGRLHAATENFEEALFHLANDVYYASEEFGLDSTVACGGYILMANIFFKQKKFDIAMSLCTEVANTWHSHLYRILDSHIQNYSSLHNAIDEAQQAEADRTLQCVLELEGQIPTRLPSLMAVACHALAMLWLLGDDFPKATEFGRRALTSSRLEPDCGLSESIQRLLKMSEAGGGLQATGMS